MRLVPRLLPFLCAVTLSLQAQVRLPQLFSDHMVLQRDRPVKVWGWAPAAEKITLRFKGRTYHTKADGNGSWSVALPAMKAGGPYNMQVNNIAIQDILIGDVWICAGQSNMVLNMERVKEVYPDDIAQADYPGIRNCFIPTTSSMAGPRNDLPAIQWQPASPATVLQFGAASWFFARQLYNRYHVPIGLINASVGGTPIEAWISEKGLQDFTGILQQVQPLKDTAYVNRVNREAMAATNAAKALITEPDRGLAGPLPWYDTAYVPRNWRPIMIPGYWEDQGIRDLNGVVWYRKEINVPAAMAGQPAKLFMGRIIDADEAYVNGVRVGAVTYQYPPRRYDLKAGLLKPGRNLVVIRVTNSAGKGGFVPGKRYFIKAGAQELDLRGDWQYKVGQVFPPGSEDRPGIAMQNQPTALFNAMIAPLVPYAVKGFLWYQGEANTGNPGAYRELLPALINDWRAWWQEGPLPFVYAQLPNYMEEQYLPGESNWAVLREGQLKALAVRNTAMAVTIDAGEWNDIHPLNKKTVGERLALGARKIAYGDTALVSAGPVFQSASTAGNRIIVRFTGTGGGLEARGDSILHYFAIAGADKKFVWAKARIEGDQVIVWSDSIPHPLFVRYAWADNPQDANLYNKEGLPASPFRTDP